MTSAPSIYESLPISGVQFRILDLEPATSFDDDIICRLRQIDALNLPSWDFAALSYTWGSPEQTTTISINSQPLLIHSNLESFLRHFRDSNVTKALWVDAICINQNDIQEKNSQIPLMSMLYAAAPRLVIWLGPALDDSDLAMQRLDRLGRNYIYAKMPYLTPQELESIQCLLSRSWWSRVWIIQEAVFGGLGIKGQRINVLCGHAQVPWLNLVLAAARMKAHRNDMRQQLPVVERILDLDSLRESAWEWMNNPFHPDKALYLLQKYRHFNASDPRDKIYSVARMFANTGPQRQFFPSVDYSLPVAEVYFVFIVYCIWVGNTIEFLHHCEESDHGGPSWVPDWSAQKRALPLPIKSLLYYLDVPWWAEPIINPGEESGSLMISYPERVYPKDPEHAARERQKRIKRLEIDAIGSGVVNAFDEIPPNFTFNQVPEHIRTKMEQLVKEKNFVLLVGDEGLMPPNDATRGGKWYNCLEEGERTTEREVKRDLAAQLRGWESSYSASGNSKVNATFDHGSGAFRLGGFTVDSIDVAHEGFVDDVTTDWADATRFMVQVGQCKAMALEDRTQAPYSTADSRLQAFWLTLLVGQTKPGVFFSEPNEAISPEFRCKEWLPDIPPEWKMAEPPLTVTSSGTLEAAWKTHLSQQAVIAERPDIFQQTDNDREYFTTESIFGLDSSFRPKTWTEEETENFRVQFNKISDLWTQQSFDLYHRPFELPNVVPDPYWSIRQSDDALALRTTQSFTETPMLSFPALNDELSTNFDDHGNLYEDVRMLRESLTPELQDKLREKSDDSVKSKPCIVPQGTLPPGMEKYALSRKFFITKKGHFGLGPRTLKPGDKVAILSGARVPFVLREVVREEKQSWTLIGESYVHGLMQGEAMAELEPGILENHLLEIV